MRKPKDEIIGKIDDAFYELGRKHGKNWNTFFFFIGMGVGALIALAIWLL